MHTIPQPMNDEDDYYGLRSVRDTCTAARAPRRPRSFVTALALSSGIFGDDSAETLTTEKFRRRASIPTFLSPPNRLYLRHCQLRRRQPSRRLRQSLRLLIIGGNGGILVKFRALFRGVVAHRSSSLFLCRRVLEQTGAADIRLDTDVLFFCSSAPSGSRPPPSPYSSTASVRAGVWQVHVFCRRTGGGGR